MGENKPSDRRTLKTKKAILQAFSELLKEKELRKITVQEIVDKADISRVTFYKYYLDVYDLEKLGISIDNEDLAYLCCYRSSGFLAVIQRWVQNGFSQSCENMVKQVSVFDDNIEQIFSNKRKQSK